MNYIAMNYYIVKMYY